jgi:imidazolonepropionase-like amidohydrolase
MKVLSKISCLTFSRCTIGLAFILLTTYRSQAQVPVPKPAPEQIKPVRIQGVTVHTGLGEELYNAYVQFEKGIITKIGSGTPPSFDGEILQLDGQHLYPGFILPASTLGLREIDALRPTLDYNETGKFSASVRSGIAYNAESELIPTIRYNGILTAQIAPTGGYISGQSSVMQLDAWNWQDAILSADEGLWMNWPDLYQYTGWWAEPGAAKKSENHDKQIAEVKLFFDQARSYCQNPSKGPQLGYKAVCPVFKGDRKLYVRVDGAKEIIEAVLTLEQWGISRPILVGAKESWRVADFIADRKIDVILSAIHDLPTHEDDPHDQVYRTPAILRQKGVRFCLAIEPVRELMGSRNLPFFAGNSVAYGLSKAEALRSITADAAAILGLEKQVGSISVGKHATFFVSKGDALDMMSQHLTVAFIQGRRIILKGKQQALYERYAEKAGQPIKD